MGLLFLLYGLIIGSFLNVVIYRVPAGVSIVTPPSTCGSCNTRIRAKHLVPVLSFLFLRGRCAYCSEKISIRYPLIEAANGLIYLMVYLKSGLGVEAVLISLFSSAMIVIAMIDFDTMDVYFSTLISGAVLGGLILLERVYRGVDILPFLLTAVIAMLFILLVIFISRGGMGFGDIWIIGLIGSILGPVLTLVAFFLTSMVGGGIALFLVSSRKKKMKEGIPFGPLLIIGFFITLFIGQDLLDLYLSLFNL